ncbi:2735_t:CDS:2, partial [Dentiscutata heterogama]
RKLAKSSSEKNAWSMRSLFHIMVSKSRVCALANARETELTQVPDLFWSECLGLRSAESFWGSSGVHSGVEETIRLLGGSAGGRLCFDCRSPWIGAWKSVVF